MDSVEVHEYLGEDGQEMAWYQLGDQIHHIELNQQNRTILLMNTSEDDVGAGVTNRVIEEMPSSNTAAETSFAIQTNQGSSKHWNISSTKLLLSLYKERVGRFRSQSVRNIDLWQEIAIAISDENFQATAKQCQFKFNNLRKKYMLVKDGNNKTGGARMDFQYMEQFDDIFNREHIVVPPVIVDSIDEVGTEIEVENIAESTTRRRKRNISEVLETKLDELLE